VVIKKLRIITFYFPKHWEYKDIIDIITVISTVGNILEIIFFRHSSF